MPPKPARPKIPEGGRRATSHARERTELQRLAFDFITHELGNAASPILMTAEVLDRDGSGATVTRCARSLRETAANVREIAATVRYFRGDAGNDELTPSAFADTGAWWRRLVPLFATCLPPSMRLPQALGAVATDDRTLALFTWCTLGSLRLIGSAVPTAHTVNVGCERNTASGVSLRFVVSAGLPHELTGEGKRWSQFVASEARAADARISVDAAPTHTSIEVSLANYGRGLRPGA